MSTNPRRPGGRTSARSRLVDAAAQIVAEQGVAQLTLDAVAAAAGVTKGGLIYHFKTRDYLLAALVEQMVGTLDLRTRPPAEPRAAAGAVPLAQQQLMTLSKATFDLPEQERQVLAQLLAAAGTHPHLMGSAKALFERVYGELADSTRSAGLALLLAAALDGISLLDLLGLNRFSPAQLAAMRRAFNRLAKEL